MPLEFAHYKMDDDAANKTVADIGSGGNGGTCTVNTDTLSEAGLIGNALNFPPAGTDYVEINAMALAIATDTIGTVSVWCKADSGSTQNTAFCIADADAPVDCNYMRIEVSPSSSVLSVNMQVDGVSVAGGWGSGWIPNTTVWHHIVAVQDGVAFKTYLNGELITFQTTYTTNPAAWMYDINGGSGGSGTIDVGTIGGFRSCGNAPTRFFDGSIADVRYYKNIALTEASVLELYNEGNGTYGSIALALAHYKMNDNEPNDTVIDDGAAPNDGAASTNTNNLYDASGVINGCFDLTAANSEYINVNDLTDAIKTDATGSISVWAYPDSEHDGRIFEFSQAATNDKFLLAYITGAGWLLASCHDASTETGFGAIIADPPPGAWFHYAVVQDGVLVKIYLNGVLQSPSYQHQLDKGAWLSQLVGLDSGRIGCQNDSGSGNIKFFDGKIEDFRYYSGHALTEQEVLNIYQGGAGTEENPAPLYVPDVYVFPSAQTLTLTQQTATPSASTIPSVQATTLTLHDTVLIEITPTPAVQALTLTQHTPIPLVHSFPATFAVSLSLQVPTINISSQVLIQSLTLTQYAPGYQNRVFPDTQALTLTQHTPAHSPTVVPDTFDLTIAFATEDIEIKDLPALFTTTLTLNAPIVNISWAPTGTSAPLRLNLMSPKNPYKTALGIRIVRYIKDPIVTSGCAQCGTFLYEEVRGRQVRGERITQGRNFDLGDYKEDGWIRCGRCGFINHPTRNPTDKSGSRVGWGLKFDEIEAGS